MKAKVLKASPNRVTLLALEDGEVRHDFESREAYLVVQKGETFEMSGADIVSSGVEIVDDR